MSTIVNDDSMVRIPNWVDDHASFRRWFHSDEFPEESRISYLNDEVVVDMSKEQVFSHGALKGEFYRVLPNLVKTDDSGCFFPDGMLLTKLRAGFSSQPDGLFVSNERLRRKIVRLVAGAEGGYVELEGRPEMVLEIVSPSSVRKDTIEMRDLYWQAGIDEYWLADARDERLEYSILRHAARGYVAARKQGGWIKSDVFNRSFRLTRQDNRLGYPEFTLSVR